MNRISNTIFILFVVILSLTLFDRFVSKRNSKTFSFAVRAEESLEIISSSSSDVHSATVIFLHGLGDVGQRWLNMFKMRQMSDVFPHVKFLFPTAPVRPVTLNNGMKMTSWFDVRGLDPNAKEDEEGILQASKSIENLIEEEIRNGTPAKRIILSGFSMGGAVALHAALTSKYRLGGVIALSTWLPLSTTFPQALVSSEIKRDLPILQCHGENDPIVHLRWAQLTEKLFKAMNFRNYTFKKYPNMAHSLDEQEIIDIFAFLREHLTNNRREL